METTTDPDHGSMTAIIEYRRAKMRELAEDQHRRGLTLDGIWDPYVTRCAAPSPEGASCSLRLLHDGLCERAASKDRPREIAEIWDQHEQAEEFHRQFVNLLKG